MKMSDPQIEITCQVITLENGGKVGLGSTPAEWPGDWFIHFTNAAGDVKTMQLSDQALGALTRLYDQRNGKSVMAWRYVTKGLREIIKDGLVEKAT